MAMTPEEISDAKARLYGGLNGVLQPGERIIVIIPGPAQEAVVGTDLRLFVYKAGPKTGNRWRRLVKSWAYRDVAEIRLLAGAKSGSITVIPVTPDPEIERYGAAGHGSSAQAPNAILLASAPGSMVEARVELLRSMVASAKGADEAPDDSPADLADDIRQLAALRDEGALTEEEFQAKKAQILEQF